MRTAVSIASAITLLLVTGLAHARDVAPGRVVFCGTVVKLTEDRCLGVKGAMPDAPLYDVTGANPAPKPGETIEGSGEVNPDPDTCQEGTRLRHVSWHLAMCVGEPKTP